MSEPDDIGRLLVRVGREYEHAARRAFRVDPFTPPAFEARLALEGYERSEARRFEIRPVKDEATWRAYAELLHLDWCEHTRSTGEGAQGAAIARGLAARARLKCPP